MHKEVNNPINQLTNSKSTNNIGSNLGLIFYL